MGGTSKSTQTQSSSLAPYDPAADGLKGILGGITNLVPGAGSANPTQTGAINQIVANSSAVPNYSAPIAAGTAGLLNGGGANNNNGAITSNLGMLNSNIGATASGANMGGNSALKPQLDQIATDVTNGVNSSFAAAGRDGSPGNAQAVARGVAAGQAPVIAAQYNADRSNQLNAANTLYGAGNSTYGMLNANQGQANQNFANGVGTVGAGVAANNAAPNAALEAAAKQFGIPASQLMTLLGGIAPVAAQFGTQNGTSSGTQQMSGAQQFGTIAQGFGSLWPKGNISFGASG